MSDVALLAGVSVSTVSHVINKTAPISAETVSKVQSAIATAGYRIPSSAMLRHGNRTIGIFAPDLANEFYSACIQCIFDEAWRCDYAVMVCDTHHRQGAASAYIQSLIANGVVGLIFLGGTEDEEAIVEASKHVPVVLGDRLMLNHPLNAVITDNSAIMRQVITRLAGSGYRQIGFISQDLSMTNVKERYVGFKTGIEDNNLPLDSQMIHISSALRFNKADNAFRLMQKVLQSHTPLPQVYICSSDLIAMGVMSAFRAAGYRVPRDIGIIGFDGISTAAYTNPPLSTIAQDVRQIGLNCFSALRKQMEDFDLVPVTVVVNAKFVQRESVRL